MKAYTVADSAKSDMREIYAYIALDNKQSAMQLYEKFLQTFRKLVEMPTLGRERNEINTELRSIAVGNYVIFYRSKKNQIEIVRVLHGARNYEDMF